MAKQAAMGKLTMGKGLGGLLARGRKVTFFLEFTAVFAVVTLVLMLALGFALTRYLANDIRDKHLNDLETEMEAVTASIGADLAAGQFQSPLSGEELAAFDSFVRENILSTHTVRVNVWNADGTIVYSSMPELIGRQDPSNEGLQEALAGETSMEVVKGGESTDRARGSAGLEEYEELMETYVPLTSGDPPVTVGAVEVYRDYSPVAAHIADMQRTLFISIAVGLAVLYLALVLMVRRGSNTIRHQQADLETRTGELKSSYESIVAVLCSALDLRDNVTHGHARRVSQIASVVAWQMGLRKEQLRQIEKAAILHDIGKIGVADAVLAKPGPLDEAEWAEMKRHPELGYQMLQGIDFLKDAAEIVYAHHERYDGSGYPRGLKGDQIPLGARIFAVVDAYDAMTSYRPYRKARSHSKAVEEIVRNSGTQFDPEVVRAFLEADKQGLLEDDRQDGRRRREPASAEVDAPEASPVRD